MKSNIQLYTQLPFRVAPRRLRRKLRGLREGAFSLVEVTMAMGLVTFCLVAMIGVIPVGLKQERKSSDQLVATQVLAAVENDFQSGALGEGATMQYGIPTSVGSTGSFFVDSAFERTEQAANAEFNVWYRIHNAAGGLSDQQMHLFIVRPQPTALTSDNIVAEAIVHRR